MKMHTTEKTEWMMKADIVERFNIDKYWWAYTVVLETLNNDNKNFYKSDSIHVSDQTDILTGYGNVEITSPNGYLSTDKIIWNRRSDMVYAPNDIYLKRDNNEIWGRDLHTNMNLDFIDLKQVKGRGSLDYVENTD